MKSKQKAKGNEKEMNTDTLESQQKRRGPKINPSKISNKLKRHQVYLRLKELKKKAKRKLKTERKKQNEALGEDAPPKQEPRTLENTREPDDSTVQVDDLEVRKIFRSSERFNFGF